MQTFPYSRHSSYTELCHLIEAFEPRDIWPCTVDKANWTAAQSMSFLFGHLYDTPCKFTHDQEMFRKTGDANAVVPESGSRHLESIEERSATTIGKGGLSETATSHTHTWQPAALPHDNKRRDVASAATVADDHAKKRRRSDDHAADDRKTPAAQEEDGTGSTSSRPSCSSRVLSAAASAVPISLSPQEYSEAWKQQAFEAAQGKNSIDWNDITLVSVSGHQEREKEL